MKALHAHLDRIEEKRSDLLDRLERWSPERLAARPEPDAWSALEVVEHLVRAEEAVLGTLADPEEVRGRSGARRSLKHRLLHRIVLAVLRFGIPVRAPSREMVPRGGTSLPALRRRWEERHGQLRRVLERLGPDGADRALFRHPISGPLTARQTLRLMEVHLDRHLGQIRRLERSGSLPDAPPVRDAATDDGRGAPEAGGRDGGAADPLAALPDRLETGRTLLRPWEPGDAPALQEALEESVGHLDPWVPWATDGPPPAGRGEELVRRWRTQREAGENRIWAVVEPESGRLLGGIGLYRRVGPGALEVGYWVRASAAGRGYATEVARAVTGAGLRAPGVSRLEMHVDPANRSSARIPRKLGYEGGPEIFVLTRDRWGRGRATPAP